MRWVLGVGGVLVGDVSGPVDSRLPELLQEVLTTMRTYVPGYPGYAWHAEIAGYLGDLHLLRTALTAAEKDAGRYRWLKNDAILWGEDGEQTPWCVVGTSHVDAEPVFGQVMDAAIDAAMEKSHGA